MTAQTATNTAAPSRVWRTLTADGESRGYDTRANTKAAARRVVKRTGRSCGIEQWSPQHSQDEVNEGWALVEVVEPEGARGTFEPPAAPLPADTLDRIVGCLHRDPIAFGVLVERTGIDVDTLRAGLLQLQKQGRADIDYGFGWRLVH
ncbi:hypothetical protein [Kineococcus radiotolerans]|uniref:DprA winged helix domain-containing protein n=1 Tax=Kineococcus radiotolerans (strain ATCC BAA-149 / DSM 14245 / SRS30216) TaxID=266940 RepID=A6WH50_KINRD|nr:hypothetical protein [Kineococcus radiotolerans]ABS06139.1 hypothetical protein Krad_4681 [Kineococcus radiotolerans SRS30216 = ATCC BAA-149]